MADTNFTTADLAAVDRAIVSGELRVKYRDREVEYRSIAELQKARAIILQALNGAPSVRRAQFSKGFYDV